MTTALATRDDEEPSFPVSGAANLSRREKAAIVVRLLLAEGAKLPLMDLPETLQAELTNQICRMRFIDRNTLRDVVEEFASELDSVGMAFPGGLEDALKLLDGTISPDMAKRLRAQAGAFWGDDPWEMIATFDVPKLLELISVEGPEVGAVILSKLEVAKAAEVLGRLPGPDARRLTIAISETADIDPDTVRRIGAALAAQMQSETPRAFTAASVERLSAILDISAAPTRADILEGLDEEDAELAAKVRAAIFTFEDIPARISAKDVPNIAKMVNQADLVTALAGTAGDPKLAMVTKFFLSNLPGRLSEAIKREINDRGSPDPAEVETAQISIVKAIRLAADKKEITMIEKPAD
ncbi:FliG C-terminal domain-containing protein [Palleronia abyssalis]|uniref:Flagellar motor switch protein FliG n=1 Tax=Palleronia abyssalis TaxID=1501240 RepID=A0A2R8C1H0_9RHOB|nr:FliG C-terminal domain-containing protein [Palleronia abyssalis]SPJ26229.1 Flagellar motor switch protein FliG [Palleronia abyssalis]